MSRNGNASKTIETEERAIRREKKNTNNVLVTLCLLVVAVLATLFLVEVDEAVITGLSYIVAIPYNGVGSVVGWEILLPEEVYAFLAAIVLIAFYGALLGIYYFNKQQK